MNLTLPIEGETLSQIVKLPLSLTAWIFEGELSLVTLKISLFFLPFLLLAITYWSVLLNLPTMIFRKDRTKFVATTLINIWDGGRSIVNYWAGLVRLIVLSIGWLFGGLRLMTMGIYQTLREILFSPITMIKQVAKDYALPGVPWLAVLLTLGWIFLESSLFTMVLTPLVSDILVSMTNTELPIGILSTGLFVFLFLIVGGSLACMHGFVEAIEKRNALNITKMAFIEVIVMLVEVVFFYREFVESVLPFFNRMLEDGLHLGPVTILTIACVAWLGIRSATWFLFGKFGTPTLLMLISREEKIGGQDKKTTTKYPVGKPVSWIKSLNAELKDDINWFTEKGEELVHAITLPPIQIFAVITNLAMHSLTGRNMFNLPIRSLEEVKDSNELVEEIVKSMKEA